MMRKNGKTSSKWKIRQVGRFPYEAGLFSFCLLLAFSVCLYADAIPNVKAAETAADGEPASVPEDAAAGEEIEELPVEKLVVVIDPGHGGDEEGGMYDSFVEKDMTLITAKAMKEELEKYEDVTVYLTREDDRKLSLEERVAYAKSVQADFLFCLHYNLSKDHNTLFGAECWVSAFGRHYSEGYAFADIEIGALEDLGLYSRGVKTRLGKKGTDYYGIIRHAVEQDLTCVLIEHCHMDHANDRPFCEGREQWEAFGRLDAESAAKYFHLRSDALGVDYGGYPVLDIPVPSGVMRPDTTEPDICMIEVTDQEMETGNVTVELSAVDYDSGMLYYDYSYDGGNTFFPGLPGAIKRRIPSPSP
ncbi:MAG: N-acetylmuramoyl-L-alanine amidase, partial [Lachnospiraceae bacterium]|nr:N-acetylmuramoyl-L-alanine amidase [Lachnospiraceae bacterium]